ncbi:MAG: ATPase [Bacteroidaceae bacterium]|nr:ATPase [Bacteroidaceae bacterium]
MILIADSGATKTDWGFRQDIKDRRIVQTQGINPFHQSKEHINKVVREELLPQMEDATRISHIYFYGAGCTPEKSLVVKEVLHTIFPQAEVEVQSDLLGAARSLCGRYHGIACILGTGSNSCEYDGEKITANVSPLGYILGDEGSGAALGKRLVGDCLKHQLPEPICQAFLEETKLTPIEIIDKVYRQPQANRFLASLTPFLSRHREEAEIHDLLVNCFVNFFQRNVMQYNCQHAEVHFTGSIAWYFQKEVKEAAEKLNIQTGKFIKSPINGLIKFHFEL